MNDTKVALTKIGGVWTAYIGSLGLVEVFQLIALGLASAYSALQIYVILRDKMRGKP